MKPTQLAVRKSYSTNAEYLLTAGHSAGNPAINKPVFLPWRGARFVKSVGAGNCNREGTERWRLREEEPEL